MRYDRIISAALETPWAILPDKLRMIEGLLADRAAGIRYTAEEIEAKIDGRRAAAVARQAGAVAVIPIHGTIAHRMGSLEESSGGVSTERVSGWLRAAAGDKDIKAIVLDVDSPGGSVSGVEELAREIHAARGAKPIVAVANTMAASAAYWLASQAEEVVVTPTGSVGSIGVYAAHLDASQAMEREGLRVSLIHAGKYKVEGNPYEALGEEARAEMQARVDGVYRMFADAVRRGRPRVSEEAMEGRMYLPDQAKALGLVDGIATLGETLARFGGSAPRGRGMRAEMIDIERRRLDLDE